jgi:4-alpha-glucanotransferase
MQFLDVLAESGMSWWQVCPLGPTGYGDSPYQCFSAFAGNPYLIDLGELAGMGLLTSSDLAPLSALGGGDVDFGAVYRLKWRALRAAHERHVAAGQPAIGGRTIDEFRRTNSTWLEPYSWYCAVKDGFGGRAWWDWPAEARSFAGLPPALRDRFRADAEAYQFYQYVFFAQWERVRAEARARGVGIIGDIPIFVAADSADAWSCPGLFELGADGRPVAAAGVPPDYFSADGQLWGNPLYRWDAHRADGYAWWKSRLAAAFNMYDVVRIDHFRGFDAYWRIPLPAQDARSGKWCPGPGIGFFREIAAAFPGAQIIAEDLGLLTPSVEDLLGDTGLPGMAVLQFAFGGDARNTYLPHNLTRNRVIYTGTHDNDTTLGWYATAGEPARDHARRYLRVSGEEIGWDLIRAAYASVCAVAVLPVQDVLSLGSQARLNSPGKPEGNWRWRMSQAELSALSKGGTAAYLAGLAGLYGRSPEKPTPELKPAGA